jgi:AmmeMemoRadiSam system protein A
MTNFLDETQQRSLLDLARRTVVARVRGGDLPADVAVPMPEASGVFVTIKRGGELRGCLGTLECRRGLAGDVRRCAADAASEDPRFPPVSERELAGLTLEVSVLGPLEPIDPLEPGAIVIGTHGLVAEQGVRRGLLLPQVASEWGWDVPQFLAHTCGKAGLPADAWQRGARISRFTAQVFGDE